MKCLKERRKLRKTESRGRRVEISISRAYLDDAVCSVMKSPFTEAFNRTTVLGAEAGATTGVAETRILLESLYSNVAQISFHAVEKRV